jgi:hypothetical protein
MTTVENTEKQTVQGSDTSQQVNGQTSSSPRTLPGSDTEREELGNQQAKEREQTVRAGVSFLLSQSNSSNEFATAAAKSRVEDLVESSESEEDPDDEPEQTLQSKPTDTARAGVMKSIEQGDEGDADKVFDPDEVNKQILPALPANPSVPGESFQSTVSSTSNLPEEDMMHIYKVRHRKERGDESSETVVLQCFHSHEEANAYAKYRLEELDNGPVRSLMGKSEIYDENSLFIGKIIINRDENHAEFVWVTRDITYIGDIADLKRDDIKPIVHSKVFNVLSLEFYGDDEIAPSIIATTSLKSLANKKAAEHYIELAKPADFKIDNVTHYRDVIIPDVHAKLKLADENDDLIELGAFKDEKLPQKFAVMVSENDVKGPLN